MKQLLKAFCLSSILLQPWVVAEATTRVMATVVQRLHKPARVNRIVGRACMRDNCRRKFR